MKIRQRKTSRYYLNSKGIEKHTFFYEYGGSEDDDLIKSFRFNSTYINSKKKARMDEICKQLKNLCNNYKKIFEPYSDDIAYLIEVELINNEDIFSDAFKYYIDDFLLYSLNVKVQSLITNRNYERGFGARNDINAISDLEDQMRYLLALACDKKKVKKLQTGFYDIVLDSEATGLLIHEFVGHLFEADNGFLGNDDITDKRIVSKPFVNIIDDPTLENGFGTYKFDDEGTLAQKTFLIKEGRMNSLLHSKQTAMLANTTTTSNARAIDCMHSPMVRMSNTYMLPNAINTPQDLIKSVKYGVYIKGTGDSVSGKSTISGFREMYLIKNGKICEQIRKMSIVGDVISILSRIESIANDFNIYGGGNGGCFKKKQGPLNVSSGGPHIKLRNVMLFPVLLSVNDDNVKEKYNEI